MAYSCSCIGVRGRRNAPYVRKSSEASRINILIRKVQALLRMSKKFTESHFLCADHPSTLIQKQDRSSIRPTVFTTWPTKEPFWRVPNPSGANPLVAERAPWRSSQSSVTGGQQPIGNPTDSCHFFCTPGNPFATPNSHSWGRLFQLPGG